MRFIKLKTWTILGILLLISSSGFAQEADFELPLDEVIEQLQGGSVKALGGKINLRSVRFETGTSKLLQSDKLYLDTVADYLSDIPTVNIAVEGYTDNVGTYYSNMQLSITRANSVAKYLISKGVLKSQLKSEGYGLNNPIATNTTPEGKAMNRRVEMRFLKPGDERVLQKDGRVINKSTGKEQKYQITLTNGNKIDAAFFMFNATGDTILYREKFAVGEPLKKLRVPDIRNVQMPDGSAFNVTQKSDPIAGPRIIKPKSESRLSPNANNNYDPTRSASKDTLAPPPAAKTNYVDFYSEKNRNRGFFKSIFPFLTVGALPLQSFATKSTVKLTIGSDSIYSAPLEQKAQPIGVGLQVGLEKESGNVPFMYYKYMYQWAINSYGQMNAFSFGAGIMFGKLRQIRLGVDAMTAYGQANLDPILLKGRSLNLGGSQFSGTEIAVKYRNSYWAVMPNLTYEIHLKSPGKTLRITASYTQSFDKYTRLKLKGEDASGKTSKSFLNVDGNGISLYTEGKKQNVIKAFDITGFGLTIGYILK